MKRHSKQIKISPIARIGWLLLLLLGLLIANLVSMGMPGAALFMMGDALVKAILWQDALGDLHGDNLWPISLRMGFVWPVGAFVVSVAMVVHKPDKPWTINKILLFLFALLAWAVGLSVYYHLGAPW